MTTRIKSPRKRTVKQRTNGKHAVKGATVKTPMGSLGRVLRPQALFRWLGPQLAAITPQYIEQTMIGAMAGSSVQAWALFDLMLKSWPELLACYQELIESVIRKKLVYEPYCEEDEKPTPSALEKQKVVACALTRMQPEAARDDSDLEGTIRDVLDAWFRGVAVSEIVWQNIDDAQVGTIAAPKSTFAVDPTNYGFATDGSLGLRNDKSRDASVWPYSTTTLNPQPNQLKPFPEHKFLIAMHKASGGSPLGGALLRPLAWWWCAANFSSDWLLNLAQLFGLPFRWVNYDQYSSPDTIAAIDAMLQNMGSNGWARFPTGVTMEMLQTGKEGSDHSPQGELLDRADRYARSLILGQTMTGTHGTTGKGGGQAFGTVEENVKADRIDAAGKFAVTVINQQLVPSILMLNYGNTDEMPTLKFLEDEVADLAEAQRDKTLADAGLEIGVDYLRKKYDIPEPADGEDTIGGEKPMPDFGGFGAPDPNAPRTGSEPPADEPPSDEPAKASDQTGHPFRGNQYVKLKIGDTVHFTEPSVAYRDGKPVTIQNKRVGRVVHIHPDGRIEVRSQSGGYHIMHPSEVGTSPISKPKASSEIKLQRGTGGRLATTEGTKRVEVAKQAMRDAINKTDYKSARERADAIDFHRQNVQQVMTDAHTEAATMLQQRGKPFPSLLPSEENKRRLMQNAGLQTKLLELNAIEDDAVFSKELLALTNEIAP